MSTFSFTRGGDPLKKVGLGKSALREQWLDVKTIQTIADLWLIQ